MNERKTWSSGWTSAKGAQKRLTKQTTKMAARGYSLESSNTASRTVASMGRWGCLLLGIPTLLFRKGQYQVTATFVRSSE